MKGILIIIGSVLLVFWAISLFFKLFGAAIHILLVVALIFLGYSLIKPASGKKD